jgi:2-polyprenyl-3-methyl-5-hydroxy-6-metoxy-1,4-benzoquinol methylase
MATLSNVDYAVHLPPEHARRELDQDQEWCEIEHQGVRRRIRFHDYATIYALPGLYEQLFVDRLDCRSPTVVADLLGAELGAARVRCGGLTALDFGAGNGLVGERLRALGIGDIVGVDLLAEAREAAQRDRPGVYDDYYSLDFTRLAPDRRRELMRRDFDVMTCVAALGFGDVPPVAFAEAFNLVGSPGWIAFNIRDRFFDAKDPSGFGGFLLAMFQEGILEERARERYTHRVSVAGEPLEYVAVVAEKHGDVPLAWARDAES